MSMTATHVTEYIARLERELCGATAALAAAELYATRVFTDLEAAPIPEEPNPALHALRTIEAHCLSSRAEITTVHLTEGDKPA